MKYIILSLKHSTKDRPVFWQSNNAGYTESFFAAGIYTESDIHNDPGYYNNGLSTVAVPLTDQAMDAIDFKCSVNWKEVDKFWERSQVKKEKTKS